MKRIFKNLNLKSKIIKWEWTKSGGLYAIGYGGYKMKSVYTLPELLKSERVEEVTR